MPKPHRHQHASAQLRRIRLQQGLSISDLAGRTGINRNTITNAENGTVPSPRHQLLIAQVFDLTPLDLWPLVEDEDESESLVA